MRGNRDVIMIQETHLMQEEHGRAARQYVAMWGFKYQVAQHHSFWASGTSRKAGVAILVNPYGKVHNMAGWREDVWSEHLIMTSGEMEGRKVLFINIYAPSHGASRVKFFRQLSEMEFPDDMDIICGGDFNCVLNGEVDRVGTHCRRDTGASELTLFLDKVGLMDPAEAHHPERRDRHTLARNQAAHHTHFHELGGGKQGSARLDRFYVGIAANRYVRGVTAEEPMCRSDHRAVLLELHAPEGPVRAKPRAKLYPPPAYVLAATKSLNAERLEQLRRTVVGTTPQETIAAWQSFKGTIATQMKGLKREARDRMTSGFRQKIKRLKERLKRLQGGVEDVQRRKELVENLQQLQEVRRTLKKRVLIAKTEWSAESTTKSFYKRICTKYGNNVIKKLTPSEGVGRRKEDDKANILRDSWERTLNGGSGDPTDRANFIAKCSRRWKAVEMEDLDAEITEDEVQAALAACKLGKACGPDDLSNEWYRDNAAVLGPILTTLFNACMDSGYTPSSFLDAYIFSISKGGDHSNPMNYRPIALLNTDYKIFTRILAWRVRKYVDRLVNHRQYGFVPGRTIHEAIDLFEAAKVVCANNGKLSQAQVLLLDFAKAYDSLDRAFMLEVLRAKGFPPRILTVIAAMHADTTVKFMANGYLSDQMQVTSGIRQGCPLAPLLFIIAVDLLYDEVEADEQIFGITLGKDDRIQQLKVAGYADDTAIYIAHKGLQSAAIRAVHRFSAVSGLQLNVTKSAAVNLVAGDEENEAPEIYRPGPSSLPHEGPEEAVAVVGSVRYLGHIAGTGATTEEAWRKAFQALRVRLTLAESKTNTVQQRAAIAAAIIVPKMMYVARHAWPSADIIKQADHSIRNYVWASAFRVPERATAGWVHKQWAEQTLLDGGLGVPNIATELKALAAMVVGVWAMTTRPQEQLVGDILQVRDSGDASHLVPHLTKPAKRTGSTLWDAGRQWTELHFHEQTGGLLPEREGMKEVRVALRCANGVRSQWTGSGLEITCDGVAKDLLREQRRKLGVMRGRFSKEAINALQLRDLWLGDAQGSEMTWKQYKHLYPATTNTHLGEVIRISKEIDGAVKFLPLTHVLPMTSRVAHAFREVCLSIVANFPSLYGRLEEEKLWSIRHQGEDPHHVFELGAGDNAEISHTWGAQAAIVEWRVEDESIQAAVAKQLQMEEASVIVAPHPCLTRMRPLWTGNRRWKQSRKGHKQLINRQRHVQIAADTVERTATTDAANVGVSKALSHVTWKRLYRMVGVSAYQTQNLYRLKMNRLRLWAGVDQGYRCMAPGCGSHASVGTMHLIWECPEARQFWEALRYRWGMAPLKTTAENKAALTEIFACRLKRIPEWLVQWGHTEEVDKWGDLQRTASEMWVVEVAVTVTAIWRWNVDRIHEADSDQLSLSATTMKAEAATREAYMRYRMSLLPLTGSKITRSRVAEEICRRWCREAVPVKETQADTILRVGFFDGGSPATRGQGGAAA